jgi:hypothetical protein
VPGRQVDSRRNPDFPHLPAGKEPGRQSRNRRVVSSGFKLLGPVMLGGCGLFLYLPILIITVAMLVAVISGGADGLGWVVLIVCLALTVGIPIVAWAVWQRVRPRSLTGLELAVSTQELRRGDALRAELRVSDVSGLPEGTEVGLVCTAWYEKESRDVHNGHSRRSRVTAEGTEYETWAPAARERTQTFDFQVPADGVFSHEGEMITWAWRVVARVPRSRARDARIDVPVWVTP